MYYTIRHRRDMDYRFTDDTIEAQTQEELQTKLKEFYQHNEDVDWWESSAEEIESYKIHLEIQQILQDYDNRRNTGASC